MALAEDFKTINAEKSREVQRVRARRKAFRCRVRMKSFSAFVELERQVLTVTFYLESISL